MASVGTDWQGIIGLCSMLATRQQGKTYSARPFGNMLRTMTRRQFLGATLGSTGAVAIGLRAAESTATPERKFRAAIIGDTGHGNYGHEHDLIFNGRENITVVAVADPDQAGCAKAAARAHALRQYAD